jgi:DUF177 domain-containing protein
MRYNVSQLLKAYTGETRHYQLQEDIGDLDLTIKPLTDLTGAVEFIRTNEGILVRANLRTTVELTCSRCLTDFAYPVRFGLEEEFRPTIDIMTGARLPQPEDSDPASLIDIHHILDLSEVVRQELSLAVPMVPLCRSACRGLCPNCGKNWNEGDCECHEQEMDPRFAVLRSLLDESEIKE